jgi:lysozyme
VLTQITIQSGHNMVPSKNALALIKQFEGCKLEAYQDPRGIWTIGYGSTGPGIVEGLTISQATAEGMLLGHIREVGLSLTDLIGNALNQNQFDAVTCFVYNVGIGNFKTSTMCKYIRNGLLDQAAGEFKKWNKAGGVVLPGLVARREAEYELFIK